MKLLIHIIQDFQPIAPFYTNILIEKKRFVLDEISNRILPFFFYSSFSMLSLCFLIIEWLGHGRSLIILLFCQVIMLLLAGLMRPRHLGVAQLVYAIGGATTVYKSVLRTMLIESGSRVEFQYGGLKVLRSVMGSLSAWTGQGIYNITWNYNIIIALSLLSTVCAIVVSLFEVKTDSHIATSSLLKHFSSISALGAILQQIFGRELVIGLICGSLSACLQIYLSIFSQTLFHEKSLEGENEKSISGYIFKIIDFPVYYVSLVIVKIFSALSSKFAIQPGQGKPSTIKSGYIEGTVKILASITSTMIADAVIPGYKQEFLLSLFLFSIVFFSLLSRSKSLRMAKILYFVTLTFIMSTEILGKSYVYRSPEKTFISCLSLFVESSLHTLINLICRVKSLSPSTKSSFYSTLAAFGLTAALVLKYGF